MTTPGTVTLHRGFQDLAVECTKDGLVTSKTAVPSHLKAMTFGNILFGGVIGVAVDSGDGAAFDYPDLISIDMGPQPATPTADAAPATPSRAQWSPPRNEAGGDERRPLVVSGEWRVP